MGLRARKRGRWISSNAQRGKGKGSTVPVEPRTATSEKMEKREQGCDGDREGTVCESGVGRGMRKACGCCPRRDLVCWARGGTREGIPKLKGSD